MRKTVKRLITAAAAMAIAGAAAFGAYAMPSDVGGTWNAEPQYSAVPENPYWDGSTAHWNAAANAVKYEVQLKRGQTVASTDTTTNTHISYRTLLKESGEYTFRVRSYSVDGMASAWSAVSPDHHVSGYDPEAHRTATYNPSDGPAANPYSPGSVNYGWTRSSDGLWMWKDRNGDYAKNTFRLIDNNNYYFDPSGIMFTGWLSLDGSVYYFTSNGVMVTGEQRIDGRDYYFNPNPGPGYGTQVW